MINHFYRHPFRIPFLCAVTLVLLACTTSSFGQQQQRVPQRGRILLWHTWTGEEGAALDSMLAAYSEINPGIEVISVQIEEGSFVKRFLDRNEGGLGPDLVLASSNIIYQLAEKQQIRDLAPLKKELTTYLSTSLGTVSDGERLFALPFSGSTRVLFYNRTLVITPPETITALLERTGKGEIFAQSTNFIESYWGVGAYDGAIVDSQRKLVFGQGGFENWLDFLSTGRTLPGFMLDSDQDVLRTAFISGNAAYYVADSRELPTLVAAMGGDNVGVALLPSGPNGGVPRPFLNLDALAFGNVSNDEEFTLALNLADFLTDTQNQLALAVADLGRVPANNQVRLTPSLPANTLTVARQIRTAEPVQFVNQPLRQALVDGTLSFFDDYHQVIEGILTPQAMIEKSLREFGDMFGLKSRVTEPSDLCPAQPGSITVWHALRGDEMRVLEGLASDFEQVCAGSTIDLKYVPYESIADQYAEQARAGGGPDVLFETSRWLAPLAEEGLLLDLSERVPAEFLQQFVPNTVANLRYADRLYGIPESVTVLALVLNTTLVADPPIDLQQLAQSANVDRRLAIPVGFFWGYWGLNPFGGFTFNSYTSEITETTGLVTWLETLQRVDPLPGIDLYFDFGAAEDAFAYEEAAYLVTGPWSLARLREEVGPDRFRVVPLPNGPVGPGSPMLQVQGTMINANASPLAIDLALAFGQFINLPASQQRFLETDSHVTASVTVDLAGHPNIASFREQAKTASLVIENSSFVTLQRLGDELYRAVINDGAEPSKAVPAFVEAVHAATHPTPAP